MSGNEPDVRPSKDPEGELARAMPRVTRILCPVDLPDISRHAVDPELATDSARGTVNG